MADYSCAMHDIDAREKQFSLMLFPQDDYDSYDSDYPYHQSYLPHVQGGISMVRRVAPVL